ncbi:MAG: hypothetical protein P8Y97_12410, partial [Candidatus Lokiarchaeota archaeon]
SLAKDYSIKNNFRLIQYCLHPKNFRVSLLALKEIYLASKIDDHINSLKEFRKIFRKQLNEITSESRI